MSDKDKPAEPQQALAPTEAPPTWAGPALDLVSRAVTAYERRGDRETKETAMEIAHDRHALEVEKELRSKQMNIAAFLALLVTGFLAYALSRNKEALILDLVKTLVPAIVGAFGGYGLGYVRGQQKRDAP